MKRIIKQILKEDRRQIYLDRIIEVMKNDYPLIKNMELYGFTEQLSSDEYNYVLSGIFGEPVEKRGTYIYNDNGYEIYMENPFHRNAWYIYRYDDNGNQIYRETSNGYWEKYEYDKNGKKVYQVDSKGRWYKTEYLKNETITTDKYGLFERVLYDDNGKVIYWEDSDGYWEKFEYDDNGNEIYREDSNGYIQDNR